MERISAAFATPARKFTDGDTSTGAKATFFNAEWCNGVQEELTGIIEASGQTPQAGVYNQVLKGIANLMYAVGDYIISEDNNNPSVRFPWQTWTAVSGYFLVGLDPAQTEFDTVGETGGSKTVTLTGDQVGGLSISVTADDGDTQGGGLQSMRNMTINGTTITDNGASAGTVTVKPTGQQPSPNLPPYRVVRMWRRTA